MSNVRHFIFPGAIAGSLILASFGYSVMARVPKTFALPAEQPAQGEIQGESISDQSQPASQAENMKATESKPECGINSNYPLDVRQWCSQIMRHASMNNLDPNLIAAVIWQESGGNPTAYSQSGAVGLMQIMPRDGIAATFQCINGPCFTNRPSISELEKPNFNIKYGTGMIAGLLESHGSLREALKFYGPMNVGYYYADKVLNIYHAYNS
jgi:soluble lytic murein transglycosylase-like protein